METLQRGTRLCFSLHDLAWWPLKIDLFKREPIQEFDRRNQALRGVAESFILRSLKRGNQGCCFRLNANFPHRTHSQVPPGSAEDRGGKEAR